MNNTPQNVKNMYAMAFIDGCLAYIKCLSSLLFLPIVSLTNWSGESHFRFPAHYYYTRTNSAVTLSVYLAPFREAFFRVADRYLKISPCISCLYLTSCPMAILSTVISIVINSVYRSLFFTMLRNVLQIRFMHVFLEKFKSLPEAFNASSPVLGIRRLVSIITSRLDISEYRIKSLVAHTMGNALWSFIFQATTRFRPTATKLPSINKTRVPAITYTFVRESAPFVFYSLYSYKSFKAFPRKVFSVSCGVPSNKLSLFVSHYQPV